MSGQSAGKEYMLDIDLAWLAGIWDGEGTIIMFTHKEQNGSSKICPNVSMVNTDLRIINKARKILEDLGCKFVLVEHQPKNSRYKLQYRFITRNQNYIILFLQAVMPFLNSNKKDAAEIVLSYCKQRKEKTERLPSKGSTPYDEEDWNYFNTYESKFRSSETTRETPFQVKI